MGDPAGIGAEITLKAFADEELASVCSPIIVGDTQHLKKTASELELDFNFSEVNKGDKIPKDSKYPIIYNLDNVAKDFPIGKASVSAGKASAEYIEEAVKLWEQSEIGAIATAPINKEALSMGGYDFPGHTEFLAKLTNTKEFAMSFFADDLCVVLLSIHVPLKKAIESVKTEKLVDLIRFTDSRLSELLNKKVKIAVSGLNPHASENGMFGDEEAKEIKPAIAECAEKYKIDVSGPFSADTIFLRGFKGEFDAVIACYHDQATIAVKCLSFGASVNVTLGLPLIRTSVDHGTAYDIAGKNLADCSSLKSSVRLAAKLAIIRNSL